MQEGLFDERITLVHIGRLMVSGGGGAVKEMAVGVPNLLSASARISKKFACALNRPSRRRERYAGHSPGTISRAPPVMIVPSLNMTDTIAGDWSANRELSANRLMGSAELGF